METKKNSENVKPKIILVGKFGKTFGVSGQLVVHSYFTKKFDILKFSNFVSETNTQFPVNFKKSDKKIIAYLNNITSPEDAKKFVGEGIFLKKSDLPSLKSNQFYFDDLEGMSVYLNRKKIGYIKSVLNHGAGDYFEIKIDKKELLVPFNNHHVLKVDLINKKISLNPIYYEF